MGAACVIRDASQNDAAAAADDDANCEDCSLYKMARHDHVVKQLPLRV